MKNLIIALTSTLFFLFTGCTTDEVFISKRITTTSQFEVSRPASDVFLLYGPEDEKKWAPGWNPRWIFPKNKDAINKMPQKDWIFQISGHGHHKVPTLWTIREFDSDKMFVEYFVVTPDTTVHTIKVQVFNKGNDSSITRVTYQFTALSEKGNKIIDSKNQKKFNSEIKHWKKLIDYYFKNGKVHPPIEYPSAH